MNQGVTISVGLAIAVVAACIWVFGNHALPRTVAVGTLTAAIGLGATRLGDWAHDGTTWANGQVAKLLGSILDKPEVARPGTVGWALCALALALFVGFRFFQAKIDAWVLAAVALLPTAAATIPGELGDLVLASLKTVAGVVAWPVTALLGW